MWVQMVRSQTVTRFPWRKVKWTKLKKFLPEILFHSSMNSIFWSLLPRNYCGSCCLFHPNSPGLVTFWSFFWLYWSHFSTFFFNNFVGHPGIGVIQGGQRVWETGKSGNFSRSGNVRESQGNPENFWNWEGKFHRKNMEVVNLVLLTLWIVYYVLLHRSLFNHTVSQEKSCVSQKGDLPSVVVGYIPKNQHFSFWEISD